MAKSWMLPGSQGPVEIAAKSVGGTSSAADEAGGDASSLAGRVSGWLRSPATRPEALAMYEHISGIKLDRARTTDDHIQRTVRPAIEKALQSGHLVVKTAKGEARAANQPSQEKSWILPSPTGKLKLGLGHKAGVAAEPLREPERLVDSWLSSAFAFGTLSLLLREAGILSPATLPKDKLRAQLLEMISSGKIVRLRDEQEKGSSSGGSGGGGSSKRQESAAKSTGSTGSGGTSGGKSGGTSESAKESPKKLSWIRIQLVDEAGKALDDEYYEIKMTDGKNPKGKWPKGQVEQFFDQIPEGTCQVTFPKLKDNGWKAPGKK